jgi:hypothetical protein
MLLPRQQIRAQQGLNSVCACTTGLQSMKCKLSNRLRAVARCALVTGIAPIASPGAADPVAIEAQPLIVERAELHAASFETGPSLTLTLTGAWRLSSADPRFGGFSAILALDGDLLLVSDRGSVLRLSGVSRGMPGSGDFLDLPEDCLAAGKWGIGDAEAVALSPDSSEIMVAMERTNALCAFDPDDPQSGRLLRPEALAHWKRNRGAETMATLAGKGTVIIGEAGLSGRRERPLLWFGDSAPGDGAQLRRMRYLSPKGYKPADAAFLSDGRLLVLDRASGLRRGKPGRLTLVDRFDPKGSKVVTGRHVGSISEASLAAKYEGLAAVPGVRGTHIVWLVSDNDFSSRKGTLLLRLMLRDDAVPSTIIAERGAHGAGQGRAEP